MADKIYCGSGIEKFDGNLVDFNQFIENKRMHR